VIKRRQLIAKTVAIAGSAVMVPVLVGENIASAAAIKLFENSHDSADTKNVNVRMEKGQTLFYVNPMTDKREQISAIVGPLEVKLPSPVCNTLPCQSRTKHIPVMKLHS